MAKKVEDPKKLAVKIAKTKALAGGREVTVNATPSAGMPGSGKSAALGEVVITADAKKPMSKVAEKVKARLVTLPNLLHLGGDYYVKSSDLKKNISKLEPNIQNIAQDLLYSEIEGKNKKFYKTGDVLSPNRADTVQTITSREGTNSSMPYSMPSVIENRKKIAQQLMKLGVNVNAKRIGKM
jgi:hypothetical protein